MFYLVAYAAMTIGAFGTVMLVSGRGEERTRISDYTGLARTNPVAAALMTLFLLSLAGIPPTAGFIAKVNVFTAAIDAGYWVLALVGVLASVAAAFFYLRVIVLMYMQEPEGAPATCGLAIGAMDPRAPRRRHPGGPGRRDPAPRCVPRLDRRASSRRPRCCDGEGGRASDESAA